MTSHTIERPGLISVILHVYNARQYLREAIQSILEQTYIHFELIVIDDCSTDDSRDIILEYQTEPRVRLFFNEHNMGVTYTLNRGLSFARGAYIARMDADDIALKGRFQAQINFLESKQDVMLCGTWVKRIGSDYLGRVAKFPAQYDDIKSHFLFENPFNHASIMMRRAIVDQGFKYDLKYTHAEDYEFWVRLSRSFKVANIPVVYQLYRIHRESISAQYQTREPKCVLEIRLLALEYMIPNEPETYRLFKRLIEFNTTDQKQLDWKVYVVLARRFFKRFSVLNRDIACYYQWRDACRHADLGMNLFFSMFKLTLLRSNITLSQWSILFVLCLFGLKK